MPLTAIFARVRVKPGRADDYLAAFAPLLEQAGREPGTLLYTVNRATEDPLLFWTAEVYADGAALAAHGASEVHADATPVFLEVIESSEVTVGETLMAKGLAG